MPEYIERNYIRKMAMLEMAYTMETETDAAVVLRMIDDAPAADVAPVMHGRWFYHDDGVITCSECGNAESSDSYYCRYCGAKMDGEPCTTQ